MALQSHLSFCQQADNSLRPIPPLCRGGFDFSLLFEEVILGALPLALIVLILPWRIWHLFQKPRKVVPSTLEYAKLVSDKSIVLPMLLSILTICATCVVSMGLPRNRAVSLDDSMGSPI
jgi:hypothetical protein